MKTIDLLLLLSAFGVLGCGGEESDGNDSSGGSTGSTQAGAGGGATAPTSTSGGETREPGYTAGAATLYPFPFDNCGQIVGLEHLDAVGFRDLTLPSPVGPGQT